MGRVRDYVDSYKNLNSKRNNRGALKNFFTVTYGQASLDIESLDSQAEQYFSENRDFERDVETFLSSIEEQAPKTVKVKISAVRVFLSENDIEFKQKFWRKLRRKVKGTRARTRDRSPTYSELRRVLSHMPIQGKALSLVLESSGMRIGEALQLNVDEVKLDAKPCKIWLRGEITKSGEPRLTFISREAVETLEEWLKVRDQYLEFACQKSNLYKKNPDDPRLFPFTGGTAYFMWNAALDRAKLLERDISTNRATIHYHVLRKVFRSQLGLVIPYDIVEALMGHEGYLQDVYKKYPNPEKTLAEYYVKGEHALLVFAESEEVTKIRGEIEKGKTELQETLNLVMKENIMLKAENEQRKKEDVELKLRIQKTEEKLSGMGQTLKELRKLIEQN